VPGPKGDTGATGPTGPERDDLVTGSVAGAAQHLTLWVGTAAQYAAVTSPSARTVYVVTA
jgi:hypothetical protein